MSEERTNTDQDGNQPTGREVPAGSGSSQTEPGKDLMTSWLRRRLGVARGPSGRPATNTGRHAGVATERIRRLLARVRSTRERALVWKPELGSLRPELVQRFSGAIVRRHEPLPLLSVRHRMKSAAEDWRDTLELTLPTGARPAEQRTGTPPAKLKGPSIFSVGQQIPPMRTELPSSGSSPRPQRRPSRPPSADQRRQPPPRSRLFARVEEVSPASRTPSPERPVDPVQPEAALEPQDAEVEAPLPETRPGPEEKREAVDAPEPAPRQVRPATQREARDAQAPTKPPARPPAIQRKAREPQVPAPSRPDEKPARREKPAVQEDMAPQPEIEPEIAPEEAPRPSSEAAAGPDAPAPEVVQRRVVDEPAQRPGPDAARATPPQTDPVREPRRPTSDRGTQRPAEPALPSSSDARPSQLEPLARETGQPPTRAEVQEETERTEEEAAARPSRTTAPPIVPSEPAETAQRTIRDAEPADRPQPVETDRQPIAPARSERPGAPPKEEARTDDTAARDEELDSGPDLVLAHRAPPPETATPPLEAAEPVRRAAAPPRAPKVQRQVQERADKPAAPVLSADGRRIVARARSKAKATLTKLVPARHRLPAARRAAAKAGETVQRVPEASKGILDRILRRRKLRPFPTLYARSPAVQIGPDSSLPLTGRIRISRPRQETAVEPAGLPPVFPMPPEARALISALEGQTRESVSETSLPLSSAIRPSPAAQRRRSIQRSVAEGVSDRVGPPGGRTEPPGLPPPPPEEPSLPLARPPAPSPKDEQTVERPSRRPDVVQRAPVAAVGTLQAEPAVVQRAKFDEPDEEIDLDDLARLVLPVIKRMLSIERERTRGRSL